MTASAGEEGAVSLATSAPQTTSADFVVTMSAATVAEVESPKKQEDTSTPSAKDKLLLNIDSDEGGASSRKVTPSTQDVIAGQDDPNDDADENAETLQKDLQHGAENNAGPTTFEVVASPEIKKFVDNSEEPRTESSPLIQSTTAAGATATGAIVRSGGPSAEQGAPATSAAAPEDENAVRYQKYLDHAVRWKKVDEAWTWIDKMLASDFPIDYQSVSALVKMSLDSEAGHQQHHHHGRTAKLRRGFSLLKKFLKKSKDAEEGLYNTCLDGRLRDVQSMEQTMVDLRSHPHQARPGAVTYGTLIKAYGTLRDFNRVLLLWEEMRTTDIPPNAVTYGCMLDACVKCNHVEMAVQSFEDMKSSNLHKNTVLYTTIIKGFAKIKDLTRAMKLYREMLAERVPCNVVTYNSLIDVAVRCNNMKVAAMVLQEMQASGIMPDIITFSTLVKGFCNEGNLRKALLVANEARMRRLPVDEIMFNSLLDGCAKIGDFDTGLMVFADMQRCNIAPSCVTFSILVRLYAGVNRLYDAIDLVFRQMPYVWKIAPTRAVYSCLMKACAQQGDPANVAYILKQRNALPESQINQLLRDAQFLGSGDGRMGSSGSGGAGVVGSSCGGSGGAAGIGVPTAAGIGGPPMIPGAAAAAGGTTRTAAPATHTNAASLSAAAAHHHSALQSAAAAAAQHSAHHTSSAHQVGGSAAHLYGLPSPLTHTQQQAVVREQQHHSAAAAQHSAAVGAAAAQGGNQGPNSHQASGASAIAGLSTLLGQSQSGPQTQGQPSMAQQQQMGGAAGNQMNQTAAGSSSGFVPGAQGNAVSTLNALSIQQAAQNQQAASSQPSGAAANSNHQTTSATTNQPGQVSGGGAANSVNTNSAGAPGGAGSTAGGGNGALFHQLQQAAAANTLPQSMGGANQALLGGVTGSSFGGAGNNSLLGAGFGATSGIGASNPSLLAAQQSLNAAAAGGLVSGHMGPMSGLAPEDPSGAAAQMGRDFAQPSYDWEWNKSPAWNWNRTRNSWKPTGYDQSSWGAGNAITSHLAAGSAASSAAAGGGLGIGAPSYQYDMLAATNLGYPNAQEDYSNPFLQAHTLALEENLFGPTTAGAGIPAVHQNTPVIPTTRAENQTGEKVKEELSGKPDLRGVQPPLYAGA